MTDREAARRVAERYGLPGVPVSMRERRDKPGPGVGTGHWSRRAAELARQVARARCAVAATPPGGIRDQLDSVCGVLERRLVRYTRIAEVGQALLPDDDTTDLDGTLPGQRPALLGEAREIDDRLKLATRHLRRLTDAIERLAAAASDEAQTEAVSAELSRLWRDHLAGEA